MRAIFRICGNESQPGLQLVKKLVMPLVTAQMLRKCRICLKGTWNFVSLFQRKPFHQSYEEARVRGQLILQWHSITKKKENYNNIHWFTIASQEKKQKWLQIAWREVFLNKEKKFIIYRVK